MRSSAFFLNPGGRIHETFGKQVDVKTQLPRSYVYNFLFRREQIEQKRSDSCFTDSASDKLITRALATAPGAMSKQHNTGRTFRHQQFTFEVKMPGRDLVCLSCHSGS